MYEREREEKRAYVWHESVLRIPDLMLHDRSLFNLGELKGQRLESDRGV